ncbi:transcriptional regulator [Streptomyces sp. GC420]|uniref:transcriptional regulator n=1 Tax=Streptomyces sp. GC420 TaxID=2697568 RepID=UPI001414D9EB|nr:transcriptional regulator [Streptomyces sp. GC420]NBM16932.1 transcriptional regulator [Streptomyces sp. GC420]
MARTARELLDSTTAELTPDPEANRLVPLVAAGRAGRETITALALEERYIVASDRRAFLRLAERTTDAPACAAFFTTLAGGEEIALDRLGALLEACGVDEAAVEAYEPLPGCQAYASYVAWLALNGEPADVVLALTANFAAWGGYCATIARALREHYGFDDAACAFFDFFAEPAPELEGQALAAVHEALDRGSFSGAAPRYGRLLQAYELMFWNTLAGPR